jgi:centrosomal CEP192-like protein
MRAKESETSRQFFVSEHALDFFSEEQQREFFLKLKGRQPAPPKQTQEWLRELRNSWQGCMLLVIVTLAPLLLLNGCSGLVSGTTTSPSSTTLDITNVQATSTTTSTTQIDWTTNIPANSSVDFGTTTSYGTSTPVDSTMVTSHQVTLSGLAAGTTYYYQVSSTDSTNTHAHKGGNSLKTAGFSISGTISPSAGGSGATLALTGGASTTTTADSSGNYVFAGLPNGMYGVAPSKAGYTFTPSSQNTTLNGANVTGVNFTANAAAVAPAIQMSSTSINFGNDVVGTTTSQALIITNTGTATLSITQISVSASAFSVSGFSLPLSVNAGQQTTITVAFAPTVVSSVSGSISIVSNAPTSPTSVGLSGSGIAAIYTLGINPTSLSFGNITTGTSSAPQTVTITNTGNANVTISSITLSGGGYSMTGGSAPVTLSPSQSLSLSVTFGPTVAGTANGSISIASNATGSPATVTLSGTGVTPVQHSVALTWNASTSTVSGYNVYRSTVSGSGYVKLNASLVSGLTYTDSNVQSATTYYYVTTAVDSGGNESSYSNQASAPIP